MYPDPAVEWRLWQLCAEYGYVELRANYIRLIRERIGRILEILSRKLFLNLSESCCFDFDSFASCNPGWQTAILASHSRLQIWLTARVEKDGTQEIIFMSLNWITKLDNFISVWVQGQSCQEKESVFDHIGWWGENCSAKEGTGKLLYINIKDEYNRAGYIRLLSSNLPKI